MGMKKSMKASMKSKPAPMKSAKKSMKAVMKAAMKKAKAAPKVAKAKAEIDYIRKIFKKADVNKDGQLTLKEFKDAAMSGNKKKKLIPAHVAKVGKKNNFNTIKNNK